jgi:hypothetical protein
LNEKFVIDLVAPVAIVPLPVPFLIVIVVPTKVQVAVVALGHTIEDASAGTVKLTCHAVTLVAPLFFITIGVSL